MRRRPLTGQSWDTRYAYVEISESADEIEWAAVKDGAAHFSAGVIDDLMSEAADDMTFPSARSEDRLQGGEIIHEAIQGTVAEIIYERRNLLGNLYPFRVDGNSIIYDSKPTKAYELLLGICQSPSLTSGSYTELPRIFEDLSKLAGIGYLGAMADGYRTGWPRPDKTSHFKEAIESLKIKSGNFESEWQWAPAEHLPDDPAPRFVKEEGLDIVIWRKWDDQRTGQLYLLGQCACGKDWLDKDKDLDLDDLREWFHLPRVHPVRSFFTPRYATKPMLNELTRKAGLIFDRVRIMHALHSPHLSQQLNDMHGRMKDALDIALAPNPMATTTFGAEAAAAPAPH